MIARFAPYLYKAGRAMSRAELALRLLRWPRRASPEGAPGLVLVQIDGLARSQLECALADGRMPFLAGLIRDEGYRLRTLYSGLPSTTPAVQAELFYGVPGAVPGFSFVDRAARRIVRMYEDQPTRAIEAWLAERSASHGGALLREGSAYLDVYTGGASDPRFCMASLGWRDLFRTASPWTVPVLAVVHAPSLVRAASLLLLEGLLALGGFVRGSLEGQDPWTELKFVPTRVAITVLMREMVRVGAAVDVARGVPVVHLNLVGYDEHAHRRGPGSRFAHWTLGGIDGAIRRLARAARRSGGRHYDVWIHSDHGQERTVSYLELHGRTVHEAVAEIFTGHGIDGPVNEEPRSGVQLQRARTLGRTLLSRVLPGADVGGSDAPPGRLVVTAMGPLGHVYSPRPLDDAERDALGRDLARHARIPLVLAPREGGARAWTPEGTFSLPGDAGRLFGDDHPHLDAVASDLVQLCHHPDAGEFVISGWRLHGPALSFPRENGAHAGPGPEETRAFALTPGDAPFPDTGGGPLRPAHLRQAALAALGRCEGPRRARPAPRRPPGRLRIASYNVHSCVGFDGRLSPERIARVLAALDVDVVCLQELDVGRRRTGEVDQAAEIAHDLEMMLAFHPTIAVEEERFGDAILSRLPMRVRRLGALPALPGWERLEPRGALWVEVQVDGAPVQVLNTHLSLHPREGWLQARALAGPDWLRHPDCPAPRVLCGDLNAFARSRTCRTLSEVLRDCEEGRSDGARRTWVSGLPLWRIDHVFVERTARVCAVEVPTTSLTQVASDHLPLVVEIELPRD